MTTQIVSTSPQAPSVLIYETAALSADQVAAAVALARSAQREWGSNAFARANARFAFADARACTAGGTVDHDQRNRQDAKSSRAAVDPHRLVEDELGHEEQSIRWRRDLAGASSARSSREEQPS